MKYLDTKPLGSGRVVTDKGGFFAREFKVDDEIFDALNDLQTKFYLVQNWLHGEYELLAARTHVPEVPEQIREILCPVEKAIEEELPKKQATVARSNTASRKKRKKKASSSSTNQKKES